MKKFIISASIYVGLEDYPFKENIEYLYFLKEVGIRRIFVSAHMPETNDNFLNELKALISEANKLQLEVILDISKPTLKKIGIIKNIYSLRLDWGFTIDDIVSLANNPFLIELNASTISASLLEQLKLKGINFEKLRVSHNFYPKPYTGLSPEDVLIKNKLYKKYGLNVMAYIPSRYGKRPPLYEGLPTIESHRHLDLYGALSDLALLEVDEVCFGDSFCDKSELKEALDFDRDNIIIPINIYKGVSDVEVEILKKVQYNRADQSQYFIRSSVREKKEINPFNTINREKFAVTIDNKHFFRYQGEVGIMRQSLKKDLRVNVVAMALISDFLLKNIKPKQKFKFKVRGFVDEENVN